jgi:multimeric flavodoxin WrbA
VLNDAMQEIYAALKQSDLVLFVSPLYWYTWSGQIKTVIDRFLPFVSEKANFTLKGKKSVLFSTAGDTDPGCFNGLRFSYRSSCELLGMDSLHEILAPGIYRRGDIDGTDWLERAQRMGKDL